MQTYFEKARFTRLKPVAAFAAQGHQAAWCQLPDGRFFPVVDRINGCVGGMQTKTGYEGVAYAELMYGKGGSGYLLTPAIPTDPVVIHVKGDSVEIGGSVSRTVPWKIAREKALLASPIPDGRRFGDVADIGHSHQKLALLEELYAELVAFPMPASLDSGQLALLNLGIDQVRGTK